MLAASPCRGRYDLAVCRYEQLGRHEDFEGAARHSSAVAAEVGHWIGGLV
jgi:hypothetical protein